MNISDIRKLDGSLLLVFHDLLRTHNASSTAERLALSQSAVSQSLSRLRKLFADQLFVRRSHGLEPTSRAIELGPRVDDLLSRFEFAIGQEAFAPAASARTFRLSAPEYVTAQIAPGLEQAFRTSASQVTCMFSHLPQQDAFTALSRYEIDVAIGRFSTKADSTINIDRFYDDEFCIVARCGHSVNLAQSRDLRFVFATSPSEVTPSEIERGSPPGTRAPMLVPHWLTALVTVATTDLVSSCPHKFAQVQATVLPITIIPQGGQASCNVDIAFRANDTDGANAWLRSQLFEVVGSWANPAQAA